jgi:hypothetical protein
VRAKKAGVISCFHETSNFSRAFSGEVDAGSPQKMRPSKEIERVQQKACPGLDPGWEPVLRQAIKLARIAYTYPRTRSNLLSERALPISGLPEIGGYLTPKSAIAELGAADRIPLSLKAR